VAQIRLVGETWAFLQVGLGWLADLIDSQMLHHWFLTVQAPSYNSVCYNCMREMQAIFMKP
jgi:hypothetical protein